MFEFTGTPGTLKLFYKAQQAFTPSYNKVHLLFEFDSGSPVTSPELEVTFGEWLLVTFEANHSTGVYTLHVEDYGSVTLSGQPHVSPTSVVLSSQASNVDPAYKEVLIWDSAIADNAEISNHKCKFNHGSSFQPLAQFNLNYTQLSTYAQMVDEMGTAPPFTYSFSPGQSVGYLIDTFPIAAPLERKFVYANLGRSPSCVECIPSCTECSDIYTCTSCSSGQLLGGLCVGNTVSSTSGLAELTAFSFDVSEFSPINDHINSQLRLPASTNSVQFVSAQLINPDQSATFITDITSFQVPILEIKGLTTFNVDLQLTIRANGQSRSAKLSTLTIQQAAYSPPTNVCGCRDDSECNSQTEKCTCQSGFAGMYCTYLESELVTLQASITAQVLALEGSNLPTDQLLSQLSSLTTEPNAITDSTAIKMASLLSDLITINSTESQLNQAAGILSSLVTVSQNYPNNNQIAASIKEDTDKIALSVIESERALSIRSEKVDITVQTVDPTVSNKIVPSQDFTVTIPQGISSTGSQSYIASTVIKGPLYQSLASTGTNQVPSTLTLDLYTDKVKQKVHNLQDPIQMQFPVDANDLVTRNKLDLIVSGAQSKDDITCQFYDLNSGFLSRDGCTLQEVTSVSIICSCNHMTDFMAFFQTGLAVLKGANYNVILALPELNISHLLSNVGFYFAIGYWSLFIVLVLIVSLIHARKRKSKNFFQKLLIAIDQQKKKETNRRSSVNYLNQHQIEVSRVERTLNMTSRIHPNQSLSNNCINEQQLPHYQYQKPDNRFQTRSKLALMSFESYFLPPIYNRQMEENLRAKNQIVLFNKIKKSPKQKSPSLAQKVKKRIGGILNKEKRCCCAFCKLFQDELRTNNQVYALAKGNSLLIPPSLRVSLFFLILLFEFALNALFYNLTPSQDDGPLFWDGIIENFWVAVYSILIAMFPLLLVGLLFSVSSKTKRKLRSSTSVPSIKKAYQRVKMLIRCKTATGLVLFICFSNFLLLYIICFCHVANTRMSEDWARSSGIALTLDLVVFELLPASLFAVGSIFYSCCRSSRVMLWMLIAIEVYRFYRNLIEG